MTMRFAGQSLMMAAQKTTDRCLDRDLDGGGWGNVENPTGKDRFKDELAFRRKMKLPN